MQDKKDIEQEKPKPEIEESAAEKTEKVRPRIRTNFGKIVLYALTLLAIVIALTTVFSIIFSIFYGHEFFQQDFKNFSPNPDTMLFLLVLYFSMAVAAFFASRLFRNKIDNKSFKDIGLYRPNVLRKFGIGLLVGFLAISIGFIILALTGQIEVYGFQFDPYFLFVFLIIMIFVGFAEELIFRGYILSTLMDKESKKKAIIISALLFTLVHSMNPNLYIPGIIMIFVFGLFAGIYYEKTRDLWFLIGIHAAWNYSMGAIYGFGVSGTTQNGIIQIKNIGPDWITGGSFGFEGSILAPIIIIIFTNLIIKNSEVITGYENS
ncbi:MAG: type II CAAX prenyl endopeptidase Rce1 family protein [Candidatus Zixiibacteriota bacterium]